MSIEGTAAHLRLDDGPASGEYADDDLLGGRIPWSSGQCSNDCDGYDDPSTGHVCHWPGCAD
jgi:hypothetical protein